MFCAAMMAGCATERPLELPGDSSIPDPAEVDVDRVRARLDRDGNGAFDVDPVVGPFTFSHSHAIAPHIKAAGEPVELIDADTASATFIAPEVAAETPITFSLAVSSATGSDSVEVSVTVIAAEPSDDGAAVADPAVGQASYGDNGCATCHGDDAGGVIGPDLRGERTAALQQRFADGAEHSATTLTEQEIADVAAWLATLE